MENDYREEHLTTILNPLKIWEDMYFAWEKSLGASLGQVVKSQGFADGLEMFLNSYLQYLKFKNDMAIKYLKDTPFATRRDMSRVAELVVSLETKVDRIEDYLIEEISKVTETKYYQRKADAHEEDGEPSTIIKNQSRHEAQLEEVREQVKGLESDLAGIKGTLQELKDMLASS